jgi:hypothetical protein
MLQLTSNGILSYIIHWMKTFCVAALNAFKVPDEELRN